MADTYLTVAFSDKDLVKTIGSARWNPERKQWYVPDGIDPAPFSQFAEIVMDESLWTRVPAGSIRLYVDLIPETTFFKNLRSLLSGNEWDVLRKTAYRLAGNRCGVCSGIGPQHPVEAHERWKYDDATGTQKLVGISSLCPACHESTHLGLATIRGREAEATAHIQAVNGWTHEQTRTHITAAFAEWEKRSSRSWTLDLTWLKTCGIQLSAETAAKLMNLETQARQPGKNPADIRAPASSNSIANLGEDGGEVSVADAMNQFFPE